MVKLSGKAAAKVATAETERSTRKQKAAAVAEEVWDNLEEKDESTEDVDVNPSEIVMDSMPDDAVKLIVINLLEEITVSSMEFPDTDYTFPAGPQTAYVDRDGIVFVAIYDKETKIWTEEFYLEAEEFEIINDHIPQDARPIPAILPADPMPTPDPAEQELTAQEHYEAKKSELEENIGILSVELAKIKGRQKSVKRQLDALVEELSDLETDGPETLPLVDDNPDYARNQEKLPIEKAIEQTTAEAVTPQADGESWRAYWIESLNLPAGVIATLRDAGIDTIGKLADFTKKKSEEGVSNPLTLIPKVGPTKAEKIEEATTAFFANYREAV